jgi:hypothetical protein
MEMGRRLAFPLQHRWPRRGHQPGRIGRLPREGQLR